MRGGIHNAIRHILINNYRFHYFKATESGIKFGILNSLVSYKKTYGGYILLPNGYLIL